MGINLSLAEGHPISRLAPREALALGRAESPQLQGLTRGFFTEALHLPAHVMQLQCLMGLPSLGLTLQACSHLDNDRPTEVLPVCSPYPSS